MTGSQGQGSAPISPETVARSMLREVLKFAQERDHEAAHGAQDRLMLYCLEAISNGHFNPRIMAKIALQAQGINFERWCG